MGEGLYGLITDKGDRKVSARAEQEWSKISERNPSKETISLSERW